MRYLIAIGFLLCLIPAFGCEEEYTYRPFPPPETASTTTPASSSATPATSASPALPTTSATTTSPKNTQTTTTSPTFTPIILSGSSSKKTPPFYIPTEEWIIEWSYEPDQEYPEYADFSFYIYPRGETLFPVEYFLYVDKSGSSYSYAGSGEYYIEVNSYDVESWTITIKPTK